MFDYYKDVCHRLSVNANLPTPLICTDHLIELPIFRAIMQAMSVRLGSPVRISLSLGGRLVNVFELLDAIQEIVHSADYCTEQSLDVVSLAIELCTVFREGVCRRSSTSNRVSSNSTQLSKQGSRTTACLKFRIDDGLMHNLDDWTTFLSRRMSRCDIARQGSRTV